MSMNWTRFSNPQREDLAWVTRMPLYFGTRSTDELHPDEQGILWLTPSRTVAEQYATPYYHKGPSWIWTVRLKPSTRVVWLRDVDHPAIDDLREELNKFFFVATGPVSKPEWGRSADFGFMEAKPYIAAFLRERGVDAVVLPDTLGTTPIAHTSVAVLDMGVVKSAVRKRAPAYRDETIGEIEKRVYREESELRCR